MANKEKMIFSGSGGIWDGKKIIAKFDKDTHSLETDDPKVISLCKKMKFKEIKTVPKIEKPKDPLYEK